MHIGKTLAAVLSCTLVGSAVVSLPTTASENGIVQNGSDASYIQNVTALTGKFTIAPELLIGDVDGNTEINALDAAFLLTAAANSAANNTNITEAMLALGLPEDASAHADCNRDDSVNALDAAKILVFVAEAGAGMQPEALGTAHYYANADGVLQTGWILHESEAYFAGEDYALKTLRTEIDGILYDFSEDGALQQGWLHTGDASYYFHDGRAQSGMQTIDGVRYYFHPETNALVRAQTVNGITTDTDGMVTKVLLDTPYISQIGYPTGCESASAVMLLRDAGYDTTIDTFIDTALNKDSLYSSGGKLYGPHPDKAFIGDPRSSSGFGCYAPVITNALNKVLTGGDTAVNLTGTSLSDLLTEYIDKGQPVAIWATINMVESTPGRQWIIPETGQLFTWKRSEHCLVLVGYDENYYYINDPYKGNGLKAYARSTVEARYTYMGSQAVIIAQP